MTQNILTPDAGRRFGAFGGRYVPETLIAALDELEVNEVITGVPGMHRHDVEWLEGWLTFMEALSFVEGRKQVIYLGDDFCPT